MEQISHDQSTAESQRSVLALGQSSVRLYGVDGLTLEEAGEIVTDRYGLSTGSCVFSIPMDGQSTVSKVEANINIGQTTHPFASFLTLETEGSFSPIRQGRLFVCWLPVGL